MQLRIGHFPLNYFLKRIGKSDTDRCDNCFAGPDHRQVAETINHFLFECQTYYEARHELTATIGRSRLSLKKFSKNTDHMKALVTFINRTERFRENT